jgi:hypothetical protein
MFSDQEIVFAQKATAIVNAAGMDPRHLDLENFRSLAPLIFTRAYCAIYKENAFSLQPDSSKEDIILISQLVIDGLVSKTRNPALSMISGFDVFQRNHRAIGILVGILFDEGQRLWLEKRGKKNKDGNNTSPTSPSSKGKDSDDSPRDIRKLLSKIDNLEDQLSQLNLKPDRPRSTSKTRRRKSSHKKNEDEEVSLRKDNEKQQISGENNPETSEDPVATEHAVESNGNSHNNITRKRPASAKSSSELHQQHCSSENTANKISPRPSSAGGNATKIIRHLKMQKDYRYPTESSVLPMPPRSPDRPSSASAVRKPASSSHANYTYDLISGRKIPVKETNNVYNQQHILTNLDQLQFNQNKQVIQDSLYPNERKKENHHNTGGSSSLPLKPEYPCKRIEQSVDEWLKRMRELNRLEADPHYHSDLLTANVPTSFASSSSSPVIVYHPAYEIMEEHDIILSIEHCHNCEHHNVSLRHNSKEYIEKAQSLMKTFSSYLFHENYCVRFGISIIPADLKGSSYSCQSNLVGAF